MHQTIPIHQSAVRTQARAAAVERRAHDLLEAMDRQADYDARLLADSRLLDRARVSDIARRGDCERIKQSHDRAAASPADSHLADDTTASTVPPSRGAVRAGSGLVAYSKEVA